MFEYYKSLALVQFFFFSFSVDLTTKGLIGIALKSGMKVKNFTTSLHQKAHPL